MTVTLKPLEWAIPKVAAAPGTSGSADSFDDEDFVWPNPPCASFPAAKAQTEPLPCAIVDLLPTQGNPMKTAYLGFTLIELMIATAVVAVLAAVALPSYRAHFRKSMRAEAQVYLLSVASREQQFLVDTRSYSASLADIGVAMPDNVARAYNVVLDAPASVPPGFSLTATPKPDQSSERCGTLSIDQNGTKIAAAGGCW
jgi:type IV pilus assembly protein PilE